MKPIASTEVRTRSFSLIIHPNFLMALFRSLRWSVRSILRGAGNLRIQSSIVLQCEGFQCDNLSSLSVHRSLSVDGTYQFASMGALVPSDHWPTGTKNTVSRPGMSLNPITGEPGKPAPQAVGSVSGRKNIRWGCQCPSRSLKYPCFYIM